MSNMDKESQKVFNQKSNDSLICISIDVQGLQDTLKSISFRLLRRMQNLTGLVIPFFGFSINTVVRRILLTDQLIISEIVSIYLQGFQRKLRTIRGKMWNIQKKQSSIEGNYLWLGTDGVEDLKVEGLSCVCERLLRQNDVLCGRSRYSRVSDDDKGVAWTRAQDRRPTG